MDTPTTTVKGKDVNKSERRRANEDTKQQKQQQQQQKKKKKKKKKKETRTEYGQLPGPIFVSWSWWKRM
jgi:hypothetical protein